MNDYLSIVYLIVMFILGAVLGSFACCQAWRLRYKELGKKSPGRWSVCLSCGHRLKRSENIPIISWLAQKGKCKKCGARIGRAEIFSEISMSIAFVAIAAFFYPQLNLALENNNFLSTLMLIVKMFLLIISIVMMWILLVYDAKWQKLPVFLLTALNICAIIWLILSLIDCFSTSGQPQDALNLLLKSLGAVAILAAPYYLLSTLSKEKLVGSGDWLVALPLALFLGHWWLALIALFVSNFLGSIYGIYYKAKKGSGQIPFGPFLIFGFIIVLTMSPWLLNLAPYF